jgi:uncharacterized protein (TIGR02246 family)
MPDDEQAVRRLLDAWNRASASGQLEAILPLMAEDVVFLTAGRPPMRGREAFAEGFRKVTATHRLEPRAEIQEVGISGDLAYCWTQLTVTMTALAGGPATVRQGPVMTVLRRQPDGRWVVARDANLLTAQG